jgi:hypothetical protein
MGWKFSFAGVATTMKRFSLMRRNYHAILICNLSFCSYYLQNSANEHVHKAPYGVRRGSRL